MESFLLWTSFYPEAKIRSETDKDMITFYYVRHGETLFNQLNRMQGACDSPLTIKGIAQAEETASVLQKVPFDQCYCSSSGRARQAAEIICRPHGIRPVPDDALREFDFGDYDGENISTFKDLINAHHVSDDWTDVHGENITLFAKRTRPFFTKAAEKAEEGNTILIVSHGSFFMHLLDTAKTLLRLYDFVTLSDFLILSCWTSQ